MVSWFLYFLASMISGNVDGLTSTYCGNTVDLTSIARTSAAFSQSPPMDNGLSTSPVRNMNHVRHIHTSNPLLISRPDET